MITKEQAIVGTKVKIPTQNSKYPLDFDRFQKEINKYNPQYLIISCFNEYPGHSYVLGANTPTKDLVYDSFSLEDLELYEEEPVETTSAINPSHYNNTNITPFQVINDWELDFYLGNVIKYICRRKKKNNELEDLKKAQTYLAEYIKILENEETPKKETSA